MKAIILLAALALTTLLNARTIIQEKYVHVVSSQPIYEKVNRFYDDRHEDNYRHYSHHKHRKNIKRRGNHYKHIVGYKNVGYYHGVKIVKKSHRRLRKIPIEIAISF